LDKIADKIEDGPQKIKIKEKLMQKEWHTANNPKKDC
jgi:hypothetical protein